MDKNQEETGSFDPRKTGSTMGTAGIGTVSSIKREQEGEPFNPDRPNYLQSPPLREQIKMRLDRAYSATRQMHRLNELDELLAKHPEVARILELMDIGLNNLDRPR